MQFCCFPQRYKPILHTSLQFSGNMFGLRTLNLAPYLFHDTEM